MTSPLGPCFLKHDPDPKGRVSAKWVAVFGRDHAQVLGQGNYGVCPRQSRLRVMHHEGWDSAWNACLRAAVMLVSASVNPEMLLKGANPDPAKPAHEPDDVARLKLSQALDRAIYAIAWERAWPHLARLLTLAGLFLTVSWAGLWLMLPSLARTAGLVLFAAAGIAALWPLIRFRWPTRTEALGRLDRGTGIRHRPATALSDTV